MKKLKRLLLFPALLTMGCETTYHYDDKGYQALEGGSLSLNDIHKLEVNWAGGNIACVQGQDEALVLLESQTDYPLYYKIEDDALTIHYAKNGTSSRAIDKLNKDLTIALPASLSELTLDTVNANVKMTGSISINKGKFNAVNGNYTFEAYAADESDFNLVNTILVISHLDVHYLTPEEEFSLPSPVEHKIDMNVTDGEVRVAIEDIVGYKVEWEAINSSFISEFGANNKEAGMQCIKIDYKAVNSDFKINRLVTR